jgi:hypothetical protein
MSQFILALASLTALFGALSATPVIEAKTYAEKFALSRDGLGRVDPDALADGFFAAWPVVMLALSGNFIYCQPLSTTGFF